MAVPVVANGSGDMKTRIGSGCFNDRATRLVRSRPEIGIICCCTLPRSFHAMPRVLRLSAKFAVYGGDAIIDSHNAGRPQ